MFWKTFSCLIFFVLQLIAANCQEKKDSVYSDILGEKRPFSIFLPEGYQPDRHYDVLYVLDAEMLARFVTPVVSFCQENELAPSLIVVGINNIYWYDKQLDSRDRDLLPAAVANSPLSGGAAKFLDFLKKELMPYMNKHYATSGNSILFGHSYGGLFTTYAWLSEPGLFTSYIASDPALWWNDGYMLKRLAAMQGKLPANISKLFFAGRSGRMSAAFGINDFDSLIREKAPVDLRWQHNTYANEHHGSIRLKAIYDGLAFSYFGYSNFVLDFFPRGGILLKDKPIPVQLYSTYLDYMPGIRYTTDGSEPTPDAPKYDYGVMVAAPAVFTMKQFSNFGPDKIRKATFRQGSWLAASSSPSKLKNGGWTYTLYKGDSIYPDAFRKDLMIKQGLLDATFPQLNDKPEASVIGKTEGYFRIEKSGYYIFFLETEDIARLFINGQSLIQLNAAEGVNNLSFVVPLSEGLHPVRIEYRLKKNTPPFSLTYIVPSAPGHEHLAQLPAAIPLSMQYHIPLLGTRSK